MERLFYINDKGNKVEFSTKSIYHVNISNDVIGISDSKNEIYSFSTIGNDGMTILGNTIKSKTIEIAGNINETNKERAIEARRRLNVILNPNQKGRLRYENGDLVRVIECQAETVIFKRSKVFYQFIVHFICPDPYWKDEAESVEDIASWIGGLQFPLEIAETGIEIGYREPSLIVNVNNRGDVKTGIRIVFRANATVTNPKLLNVDTREFIKFNNLTLYSGDVLEVSTHYGKKKITLNRNGIITDAFKYLDIDSSYLMLETGDNLFRYDAETNQERLEVTIYYDNRYIGV